MVEKVTRSVVKGGGVVTVVVVIGVVIVGVVVIGVGVVVSVVVIAVVVVVVGIVIVGDVVCVSPPQEVIRSIVVNTTSTMDDSNDLHIFLTHLLLSHHYRYDAINPFRI